MKRTKYKILLLLIIVGIGIWIAWGNKALMVHDISITNSKIPDPFNGYKIVQISDLHNTSFGVKNIKLLSIIEENNPDSIVLTGDLIDSYHTDLSISLDFCREAIKLAPIYYVTGNHEARIEECNTILDELSKIGVHVLQNEVIEIEKNQEILTMIGVDDPSFKTDYLFGDDEELMDGVLKDLMEDNNGFTILLSHRPELFNIYCSNKVDLVFSGHAHGGQFRIPLLGGLVAPNQGLLPTYDGGVYTNESTTMIVSRGLGNSIIPVRINNRPEIIVVELQNK